MGLSSTVNPQCTNAADGRTDGRTDMLLAIAHLMLHALHAWHRWAKKVSAPIGLDNSTIPTH